MSSSRVHALPVTWEDERDTPFFRITAHLFTPQFCHGASALLASYDGGPERIGTRASLVTPSRQASDLLAARVRRSR